MEFFFWSQAIFWILLCLYLYYIYLKGRKVQKMTETFDRTEPGGENAR